MRISGQDSGNAAAEGQWLEAELGSMEPGKRADVVVLSKHAVSAYPSNNPVHLLALTTAPGINPSHWGD